MKHNVSLPCLFYDTPELLWAPNALSLKKRNKGSIWQRGKLFEREHCSLESEAVVTAGRKE